MDAEEKLPAIPEQRTVFLVNTYVVHTVQLLNKFSAICQQKLAEVHRRVQRLDATVTLLEAKLRSAEDSDGPGQAAALDVTTLAGIGHGPEHPLESADDASPHLSVKGSQQDVVASPSASSSASERLSRPKVKDDPSYSRFFRMLHLGVPERAVKLQMSAEGLEPSLLDTPDAFSPAAV